MAQPAAVGITTGEVAAQPTRLGASPAGQRHAANGIVFPDLSGPYYAEVLLGYVEAASRAGRSVLVQATEGLPDVATAVRELAGRVDGLVMLGRTASDQVVEEILATGLPVVLVARPPVPGADCLRVQNRSGAVALGEHLAAHRFRSVRFVGSPGASPDAAERWEGVRDAFAGHGSRLDVVECAFNETNGYHAVRDMLAAGDRPRALVCANDEIALGAVLAAEEAGLHVGSQISITGWDDVMAARYSRPGLTTVHQPMHRLGALAAEVLDRRMSTPRAEARRVTLPTELVVRSSCGCAPGARP
ncbi:LacI family DNA-binding transcriptional regulator [Cellulomonas sp. KRMCY2]|uniref:LacI family DNA-binding transcriptional regulator n=1 Tax=Cellulomonas sp. KRMCY2 TaxID=1304865 RepID=UPI00045EB3AE|nr:substrate-binding domain-containing protein [Cellulomonas sp. KRMCY2]